MTSDQPLSPKTRANTKEPKKEVGKEIRREVRQVAILAWPIILGNLSHILIGLADSIMIGQLGKVPLAACTFGNAVMGFIIIASVGMTSVVAPLVAQASGKNDNNECGQIFKHSLFLNSIGATLLYLVLLAVSFNIELFDQPAEIISPAKTYLQYISISLFFVIGFNVCRQFSEGLSIVKPMLFFAGLSLVLNVFLNWILIFGRLGAPKLGLQGAAIATLLTRAVVFFAVLFFILKSRHFQKYLSKMVFKKERLLRQLKLGLPGSLQYASEAGAFAGAAIVMGWVGTTALAAHQIVLNMAAMAFMVALGTSVAVSVRVGQAIGQENLRQAKINGFTGIGFAAVFMLLTGLIFYFAREVLPTFYIDDSQVIALSAKLLVIAAVFQLADGTQGVAVGALRGLPDVVWPTIITIIAYWLISLPVGYYLAFQKKMGGEGVWWGMALGLSFSALMLNLRFYNKTRSVLRPL